MKEVKQTERPSAPALSRAKLLETIKTFKPAPSTSRVMQVFLNQDMRNGHLGLAKVAKDNGIDVDRLADGLYVVFINAAKNKLKLYASNNVVAYLMLKTGQQLDLNTIRNIPKAFHGTGRIDYDETLKTTVLAALAKKS